MRRTGEGEKEKQGTAVKEPLGSPEISLYLEFSCRGKAAFGAHLTTHSTVQR